MNFFGGGGGKFMESPPVVLNMNGDTELTTEELFAEMCATSRIPLEEVAQPPARQDLRRRGDGRGDGCRLRRRLDVGNAYMLARTRRGAGRGLPARRADDSAFPFRLIPRRHSNFMNSSGTNLTKLNRGKPYNPAYMHPDAHRGAGAASPVTSVTITSPHDSIPSVLEADDTLRRDVVAMHHAFGGMPAEDDEFRDRGSNVGRLVPTDDRVRPRSPACRGRETSR